MPLVHSASVELNRTASRPALRSVLVGLVGENIQRSRTPRMHMAEGGRQGLHYTYTLIDTAHGRAGAPPIGDILACAQLFGFAGLNVTYPFKQAIMTHLDEVDDGAARVGAVNTVVFRDGRAIGYNTDLWGFAQAFRFEMAGAPSRRVLQLGAGGAGSAVANALVECGVGELVITDIDQGRAEQLASRFASGETHVTAARPGELADMVFDGIVNTTPVGMDKSPGLPIDPDLLRRQTWVADIVYFPLETALLARARALGCRTMSGAGMAVFQAVKAFELFTGLPADVDAMRVTFEAFGTGNSPASQPG